MAPNLAATAGNTRTHRTGEDTRMTGTALHARVEELESRRGSGVETRLRRARDLEAEATAQGTAWAAMRARLVVADMLHRVGQVTGAASLAGEVSRWAEAHEDGMLLARSHLVMASIFDCCGDSASALDHAVRGIALLDDDAPPRRRFDHLLALADTLAMNGSVEQARQRYAEAAAVCRALGDGWLMDTVLNNLAMLECEAGEIAAALDAVRALEERPGGDLDPAIAETIARVHLAAGDLDAAERMLDTGCRLLGETGDVQALTPAEISLTRARVLQARNRVRDAHRELDECLRMSDERGLGGARVEALGLRAELLASERRFEEAFHAHRAFHSASEALRCRRQEAAARTRQALFETEEARRAARAYRAQARLDGLTGLPNRRFVDEELPELLRRVTEGHSLVVAIVDVDHFKRVNDTFTHEVGDRVLQRVAAILAAGEPGPPPVDGDLRDPGRGFAARLGGEEFVIVVEDAEPADAMLRLDGLRRDVEAEAWAQLAAGLAVTVSMGAAVAVAGDTERSVLSRADGHLYAAKREGRNRLVCDPWHTP